MVSADDWAGEITFYEMVDGDAPYRPFKMSGTQIEKFSARGAVTIVMPGYVDFGQLTRF